jgi:hypothetical protein
VKKYNAKYYTDRTLPLPDDINAPVEKALNERFKSMDLSTKLREWREKRRFGDVCFEQGSQGCQVAFSNGIVTIYYLTVKKVNQERKEVTLLRWSVKNTALETKTPKRENERD